ncbi:TetR/AcrR family transcriptional regulator [Rhizobium grahamii]|uniref:TetR/AcrR family transcriptional regulator n=1 Tax=Rhizobium grahamii TaxID=1120045 RepID=A0A5Q0C218_9HYPH|nr:MULTISPECIES: TetR family transcriptional regulator [Rhizobium]QFY59483.1 TetR/AcrR family transcriptional regulator [Rhizobium grahamii]QRM47991.1 TetR/AcrR family transcriptional regulator [Rhizobium sp. BG6]
MPRPRTLSDEQLLDMVLGLVHAEGPDAASFGAVAKISGLSGSTLVQRFGTKAAMLRACLLRAWDRLDMETARLIRSVAETPEGAVDLLTGLSRDYGEDAASYAEGLLVLREDLRDPALRARGAAWGKTLAAALDRCLGKPPLGRLMLSQWQGCLLWWGFEPQGSVEDYVRGELGQFLRTVA